LELSEMVKARAHLWQAQCRLGIKPAVTVVVNDFSFRMDDPITMTQPLTEPYLKCHLSPENLRRILTREAIWNNLEVAGDILYDRRPNIYNPDVFTLMNFFQLPRE